MDATSRREILLRVVPIFVVWLVMFGSRPFQLGFCCEDWVIAGEATHHGSAFSYERFRWHLMVDSSRPVAATVRFLMSSLASDSTFLWHTLAALMSLAVAFSVFAFARALLRLWGGTNDWGATVAAVIWLCLPWTMGATAFRRSCRCCARQFFSRQVASQRSRCGKNSASVGCGRACVTSSAVWRMKIITDNF